MIKRLVFFALLGVALAGCSTPNMDPFAMQQRLERANNPLLHVRADPSQRLTNGNLRRVLRGDRDVGAFEVEIGDGGAGRASDTGRLLKKKKEERQ